MSCPGRSARGPPAAVAAESMRVLRPDGRAVVFNKFAPEDRSRSVAKPRILLSGHA
jgi:hypothetical protein